MRLLPVTSMALFAALITGAHAQEETDATYNGLVTKLQCTLTVLNLCEKDFCINPISGGPGTIGRIYLDLGNKTYRDGTSMPFVSMNNLQLSKPQFNKPITEKFEMTHTDKVMRTALFGRPIEGGTYYWTLAVTTRADENNFSIISGSCQPMFQF